MQASAGFIIFLLVGFFRCFIVFELEVFATFAVAKKMVNFVDLSAMRPVNFVDLSAMRLVNFVDLATPRQSEQARLIILNLREK